jgi:hypothetical protein
MASKKKADSDRQKTTFYLVYWVEKQTTIKGKELKPGYYRITYDLSGMDYPHDAQYSEDRYKWEDCEDLFKNFQEFSELFAGVGDKMMKFEKLDYVETVVYRGQHVPVFIDDYGQCFYCIYNNEEIAFGSFQSDYEDEVRHLVDYELDYKPGKRK